MLQQKEVLFFVEPCLKLLLIQQFFKVFNLLLQCLLIRDIRLFQRNAILFDPPSNFHQKDKLITSTHGNLFGVHVSDELVKFFGVVGDANKMFWHVHVTYPAEIDLALEGMSDVYDQRVLDQLEVGGKTTGYLSDYLVHCDIDYITCYSCIIIIRPRDKNSLLSCKDSPPCSLDYNIWMIQQQDESLLKQQETSELRKSIFFKIVVSVLRYFLYIGGYHFRQYEFSSSFISIFISLGAFVLAEILYWNRYLQGERKEFNIPLTVILHVSCVLNLLGMGFTFKYADISPSQHYFLFEVGLLFNYCFSIIYLCGVYFNPPVDNVQGFLSIHEPINQSIQYIFIGLYMGSFFDMLAFLKQSASIFYILNLVLITYLFFNFLKSKSLTNFKQAFTSQ